MVSLAEKTGLQYHKMSIRNNKTNWGSCSSGKHISLNLNLMKLPDHLIDYVILHELAHTKIRNHGPAFWKLLDEITGNQARKLAAELRKFSSSTW
jgi:predicted metal-dependent hydrolase